MWGHGWASWCRYWVAPGGRIAAAALRIAIAVSLLLLLYRTPVATSGRYYSRGVWLLYPGRPPVELVQVLAAIAWVATAMMLVGWRTRLAHAVSLVACLAVAAYQVSGQQAWSHHNVPPLLASVALLGARTGDALSVDAWLRRRRGLALPPANYVASVRLAQLLVASVFFIAAMAKLHAGGLSLSWALSDNLRHQLLVRFDWISVQRTPLADWLLAEPWRYQLFACLNLFSQVAPMLAVVFIRHPRVRAVLGLVWIAEVLALGLVMRMWVTHWLPLAAVFVDWDALLRRRPVEPPPPSHRRVALVTALLALYVVNATVFNQRLRLYPFSGFPMFSSVRAKRPYGVHQSYELIGGRIEVVATPPLGRREQTWVDRQANYRWMWKERRPAEVRANLAAITEEVRRRFPDVEVAAVRMWLVVDRAPAYPEPARLERHDLAVLGELHADGTFRTALGSLVGTSLLVDARGVDLADAALLAIEDDLPQPRPLMAVATARGFVLATPLPVEPAYIIARPRDGSVGWLVAHHASRGF